MPGSMECPACGQQEAVRRKNHEHLPYEEVARLIGEDEAAELKAIEKEAAEKWAW